MIKIRNRLYGHVRNCPSQECADQLVLHGKKKDGVSVWEYADKPVVVEPEKPKRKYGEPPKIETHAEIQKSVEKPENVEKIPETVLSKEEQAFVDAMNRKSDISPELANARKDWQEKFGKKPHHKKNLNTLLNELNA